VKKCIFLLFLTGFQFYVRAQDMLPDVVTIDFLQPHLFKKYTTAPYGHKVIFRIQNINRNLYKVNESFTQTDFNTTLPRLFTNISLPPYFNLALPDVEDLRQIYQLPSPSAGSDSLEYYLRIIHKSSHFVSTSATYNNRLTNLYQACGIPYADIEQELIIVTSRFLPPSYPKTRPAQVQGIRAELEEAIENAVTAEDKLLGKVPGYSNRVNLEIRKNEDIIWEWEKFPLDKKDPNYRSRLNEYRRARESTEAYENQLDSLVSMLKTASSLVNALEKFRDDNRIQALVNNYELINEANFTYYSDSLYVSGDELKLSVKVSPVKALPCSKFTGLVVEETYRTKGGWKVDFSTGVLMNGGSDEFSGNEFSYRALTDSTASIQRRDGGSKLLLSVGAFLHIYKRSGSNINVAISPGLSTTTAFDGLMFHLGGSALFGKRERLVLTMGATAREVEVLDHYFQEGRSYPVADLPNSPPMVKVFPRIGWFVSLTYNWSPIRKR